MKQTGSRLPSSGPGTGRNPPNWPTGLVAHRAGAPVSCGIRYAPFQTAMSSTSYVQHGFGAQWFNVTPILFRHTVLVLVKRQTGVRFCQLSRLPCVFQVRCTYHNIVFKAGERLETILELTKTPWDVRNAVVHKITKSSWTKCEDERTRQNLVEETSFPDKCNLH